MKSSLNNSNDKMVLGKVHEMSNKNPRPLSSEYVVHYVKEAGGGRQTQDQSKGEQQEV